MREVDIDLYEFLQKNETTIYLEDNQIEFAVFVDFIDLYDFVKIVGTSHFEEGGLQVAMLDSYLCIPITNYLEGCGHKISSYKDCFKEDDWEFYKDKIIEWDRD